MKFGHVVRRASARAMVIAALLGAVAGAGGGCAAGPDPVEQAAVMTDADWQAFVVDWRRDFGRALESGDVASCRMHDPVVPLYAWRSEEVELRRYVLDGTVDEAIRAHGRPLLDLASTDARGYASFGGLVTGDGTADRRIRPLVTLAGGRGFLEAAAGRLALSGAEPIEFASEG